MVYRLSIWRWLLLLSALAFGHTGFGRCGMWVQQSLTNRLSCCTYGIFPDQGMEPASSALAGRFLTTGLHQEVPHLAFKEGSAEQSRSLLSVCKCASLPGQMHPSTSRTISIENGLLTPTLKASGETLPSTLGLKSRVCMRTPRSAVKVPSPRGP